MSGHRTVRVCRWVRRRVWSGAIGKGDYLQRMGDVAKTCWMRQTPGREIHVHGVRQEIIASGICRLRADKYRICFGFWRLSERDQLLETSRAEIKRQCIEPILWTIDLRKG